MIEAYHESVEVLLTMFLLVMILSFLLILLQPLHLHVLVVLPVEVLDVLELVHLCRWTTGSGHWCWPILVGYEMMPVDVRTRRNHWLKTMAHFSEIAGNRSQLCSVAQRLIEDSHITCDVKSGQIPQIHNLGVQSSDGMLSMAVLKILFPLMYHLPWYQAELSF